MYASCVDAPVHDDTNRKSTLEILVQAENQQGMEMLLSEDTLAHVAREVSRKESSSCILSILGFRRS